MMLEKKLNYISEILKLNATLEDGRNNHYPNIHLFICHLLVKEKVFGAYLFNRIKRMPIPNIIWTSLKHLLPILLPLYTMPSSYESLQTCFE